MNAVTLQINVAPTDHPHAIHTLAHQLRVWSGQVQEIVFSLDLHRTAHGGRFGEGYDERLRPMLDLLGDLCGRHPQARIAEVDYAPQRMREIALAYTGRSFIPAKDTKGAPFYPYFHGLEEAGNDLVLHLDSDMIFGGSSSTWVAQAQGLLAGHGEVLACNPLAGPPTADGGLRTQWGERFGDMPHCFGFPTLSSRLFLIDRLRLRERLLPLALRGPVRPASAIKARLHGNPPYRAAELTVSDAMAAAGMLRVDFLGEEPGMWSLHPPYRSARFYRELPVLIERIEAGEVPEAQRGDYELNDSMIDWSDARRRARVRRIWA